MFVAENYHVKSCGDPPEWLNAPREKGERRFYFENALGEQWIAYASSSLFRLTGGDTGWDTIEVKDPDYTTLVTNTPLGWQVEDTLFNTEEGAWLFSIALTACRMFTAECEGEDVR